MTTDENSERLVCPNCGQERFYITYRDHGAGATMTTVAIAKCSNCGREEPV